MVPASKEEYTKVGNKPPKKNTRSSGCFSVIDTDEVFFDAFDLSLAE